MVQQSQFKKFIKKRPAVGKPRIRMESLKRITRRA